MHCLQDFLYANLLHRWLGTAVLTFLSIVTVKIYQSNSNFSSARGTVFNIFMLALILLLGLNPYVRFCALDS